MSTAARPERGRSSNRPSRRRVIVLVLADLLLLALVVEIVYVGQRYGPEWKLGRVGMTVAGEGEQPYGR